MRRYMCLLPMICATSAAVAMPPAEEARARALIAKIEAEKEAVFIRNGTEYSSANAAEFLRRKCAKDWGKMADAREFVAKCASASSTSGKPYMIKLKGEAPRPSGDVLGEWLRAIEAK